MDRVTTAPSGRPEITIPPAVRELLERFWHAGHAGYAVGGALRDALLGREPVDWDIATDAQPERVLELFDESVYENRFGTVAVQSGGVVYQVTTFRSDHDYADFRRPHRVEWTDRVELDLARRDFTVNAMAWGAGAPVATDEPSPDRPALVDPFDGRADVARRLLRAVGEPGARFREDALRMIRAVRFATTLDLAIEPATRRAIDAHAELAAHLSGERIAAELDRILRAPRPSTGLRLLEETGLLRAVVPELAMQRGVRQNKIPGEDLWDHTVRAVDAVSSERPVVRLAALLHDVGKPATASDGHFYGHDRVGAEVAAQILSRLRYARSDVDRVVDLVRQHMFIYDAGWSDAAVRRFIAKIGPERLDDLWALRAADNVGSGLAPDGAGLGELRARADRELAGDPALEVRDLAIGGEELIRELGLSPGPTIGRLLAALLERVIIDPVLNDKARLLVLARSILEEDR